MKRIIYIGTLFATLVLLLSGCGSGNVDWSEFPVPPDAGPVKAFTIESGSGREMNFVMEAAYPDLRVSEFYSKQIGAPWVACDFTGEWQGFREKTRKAEVFVHQLLRYWVNYETDRLLLLAIRYESECHDSCEVPDNTTQNVYLVEYIEDDVAGAVTRLGLVCDEVSAG